MTVGELSRRTGLSIRVIRAYEGLGLIYSAGRSEGNYRLFDETALWCAGTVERLRSVGLTLAEIQELAGLHRIGDERGLEQHLDVLLERVERRLETKVAELTATLERTRAAREQRIGEVADARAVGPAGSVQRT